MTSTGGSYRIHAAAHGPHWIAWITRESEKPDRSVVFVAETEAKARERARLWAEQSPYFQRQSQAETTSGL
jgi:hypothetical protein